ncbi:hypothetical protein HBH98_254470 [Parastagonospora nodorum]|nr:hypothetical protein HBH53_258930 [Parastagonospora nodorum]KAH3956016.1 hypothetical protein HBH51_258200 [Parastagonospora nodorum]KAH4215290.1 hypothetical protein HBI06_257530 [Parastagonospora nodorum]KAH4332118.1 hypothetical protein HBH98_254470 [Parastagonospora nodorum]KAH4354378.1 hypothetical protein HBH97_249630 [Parastagonospora nodorum]
MENLLVSGTVSTQCSSNTTASSFAEYKPQRQDSGFSEDASQQINTPLPTSSTTTAPESLVPTTPSSEPKVPPADAEACNSTEVNQLTIVRGFGPGYISEFTHSTPANQKMTFKSEGAIESDESAIESDEGAIEQDDSVWEDDDNEESSGPASPKEDCSFQCLKIEVKPPVDRSLLTKDFQKTMQNEASPTRSPSVDRRSRTTRPNGPSCGNSPQVEVLMMMSQAGAKPMTQTTSNNYTSVMSSYTTRSAMIQSELTRYGSPLLT